MKTDAETRTRLLETAERLFGERGFKRVTVREIDHARRRVTLDCACRVGDTVVLDGEALVLAPSRKFD